ncbi:MAG: AEC family transporter [Clostridiales bacterium]|nr:AEC family transporter [Clostridiales bacterium]
MELSLLLAKQIASMFLMIFLGFISLKAKLITPKDGKVLSKVAMYVVSPCMILTAFQIEYSSDKLLGLGLAALAAVIVHGVYILLAELLKKPLKLRKIERASLIYSNAGNMIIPLVSAVIGSEWVFYTSAFIAVQTFLMWTHAKSLVQGEKDWSLKSVFLNPNIISICLSLILFICRVKLPDIIASAASSMGNMIGPLCMFVIGMLIAEMNMKTLLSQKRAFLILLGRLIVFPLVTVSIFCFSGLSLLHPEAKQILFIVLLASCSPQASSVTQFAQIYDSEPGYSSIINVVTTLSCIVTMPLIVMVYQLLSGM